MGKEKRSRVSVEVMYKYIVEYERKHLVPPTLREISDALHISSTSSVHFKLKELCKKGWIKQDNNGKICLVGFEIVETDDLPISAKRALMDTELLLIDRKV